MFTYRDFEMGTLGLAWTGDLKNAGGVCEKNGVSDIIDDLLLDLYWQCFILWNIMLVTVVWKIFNFKYPMRFTTFKITNDARD
jgi:hypothetical protein